MIAVLALLLAGQSSAPVEPKPADQPAFVSYVIKAVAAKDAEAIRQRFGIFSAYFDDKSASLPAAEGIALLEGCSPAAVHDLHWQRVVKYSISYVCPARHEKAVGCDTGDLLVVVTDPGAAGFGALSIQAQSHCPPRVPRMVPLTHTQSQ